MAYPMNEHNNQSGNFAGILLYDQQVSQVEYLEGRSDIVRFLKKQLWPEWNSKFKNEILILEVPKNQVIFRAVGGVDLFSKLELFDISLPEVYDEIKSEWETGLMALDPDYDPAEVENDFEFSGFSTETMVIEVEAMKRAKAAKCVGDIPNILKRRNFDIFFHSEDGERMWSDFDKEDFSVSPMIRQGRGWVNNSLINRVKLDPKVGVSYSSMAEGIISFVILDPVIYRSE